MTQLVELQAAQPRFEAAGIKLYAVSYDEQAALAEFARHHGITYPLLSDKGSRVIRQYGIQNHHVRVLLTQRHQGLSVRLSNRSGGHSRGPPSSSAMAWV